MDHDRVRYPRSWTASVFPPMLQSHIGNSSRTHVISNHYEATNSPQDSLQHFSSFLDNLKNIFMKFYFLLNSTQIIIIHFTNLHNRSMDLITFWKYL